jgi:hypothetical protein
MTSRTSSDVLSAKRDRPIEPQKILPAKAHNPVLQHNLSNRTRLRPRFASENDPTDGAETGGAEPQIAEQSRSWRAVIGESGDYARFLKRQLSFPVSMISQW